MKIAIAVNHYYPSVGGAEIVAQAIAEHLNKHHDVFVFTRKSRSKNRNPKDFNYPVFDYHPMNYDAFDKKIRSLELDFLIVYSDVFDFFRQIIAHNKSKARLILCLCGANWLYSHRNYINSMYRSLDKIHAIICHSNLDRDYKLCSSDKFKNKLSIIPNGVWKEEFDKNTLSKDDLLPKLKDKQWILNVSNFFPGKGQEHLIKILDFLPNPESVAYLQVSHDIEFSIGKQLESIWKARISPLKKKGMKVKLLKNIDREKVVGFFKQSNVFAFSSEKEVAPLVLLESMAASLPWISTNVGNSKELEGGITIPTMKDSRFHSVFSSNIQKEFATGIQKLLNTPKIGESGRQQIEEKLAWEKILPQYLSLIEN